MNIPNSNDLPSAASDPPVRPSEHTPQELYRQEKQLLRKHCSGLCFVGCLTAITFTVFPLLLDFLFIGSNSETDSYFGFSPTGYHFFSISLYLLCLGLPALAYLLVTRTPVKEVLPFEKTRLSAWICLIILGFAVCLLANFPAGWVMALLDQMGFPPPTYPTYLDSNPLSAIFYFISVAVVPPLVEEFLFRGIILQKLKRYGTWFAILTSALLFALFHGDLVQAVFAFFCGIALAFVTLKTKNLWPAVIIHLLNNGNSALLDMFSFYVDETFANTVYVLVCITVVSFAMLCIFILLLQDRQAFRLASESTANLRTRSKCHALFWSVGGMLFWISSIVQMVFNLQS